MYMLCVTSSSYCDFEYPLGINKLSIYLYPFPGRSRLNAVCDGVALTTWLCSVPGSVLLGPFLTRAWCIPCPSWRDTPWGFLWCPRRRSSSPPGQTPSVRQEWWSSPGPCQTSWDTTHSNRVNLTHRHKFVLYDVHIRFILFSIGPSVLTLAGCCQRSPAGR